MVTQGAGQTWLLERGPKVATSPSGAAHAPLAAGHGAWAETSRCWLTPSVSCWQDEPFPFLQWSCGVSPPCLQPPPQ